MSTNPHYRAQYYVSEYLTTKVGTRDDSTIIYDLNHSARKSKVAFMLYSTSQLWSWDGLETFIGPGMLSAALLPTEADLASRFKGEHCRQFTRDQIPEALKLMSLQPVLDPLICFLVDSDGCNGYQRSLDERLHRDCGGNFRSVMDGTWKPQLKQTILPIGGADLPPPGFNHEVGGPVQMGGAGAVLAIKICSALAEMEYALNEVQTVGRLVARNLLTIGISAGRSASVEQPAYLLSRPEFVLKRLENGCIERASLLEAVPRMIRKLLDPQERDPSLVNVNSNEVVLLVNSFCDLTHECILAVTDKALETLHETWNIWPVRVYAGRYLYSAEYFGISITLLNVVNTDIGGPSMIELLDAPAEAPVWRAWDRREIWNARNMLSREEKDEEFDPKHGWLDSKEILRRQPLEYRDLLQNPDLQNIGEQFKPHDSTDTIKYGEQTSQNATNDTCDRDGKTKYPEGVVGGEPHQETFPPAAASSEKSVDQASGPGDGTTAVSNVAVAIPPAESLSLDHSLSDNEDYERVGHPSSDLNEESEKEQGIESTPRSAHASDEDEYELL